MKFFNKLFFKAEDFPACCDCGYTFHTNHCSSMAAKKIAEEKFNAWYKSNIEDAPKVWCGYDENGEFEWYGKGSDSYTHLAKLVDIRKVE